MAGLRRRTVPMFLTGRNPNNVTLPDLLDGAAITLDAALAKSDDEDLTRRMCVPCGTAAWFKGHVGTTHPARLAGLKHWVKAHRS